MRLRTLAVPVLVLAIVSAACQRAPEPKAADATRAVAPVVPVAANDDDPIVPVVAAVRPAVVNVSTEAVITTPLGTQEGGGTGTGFIVRPEGIIVTNYHVVEGAQKITVITQAPNSHRYDARVIGGDQDADIAVLKIEPEEDLPTVTLGSSNDLQLGQRVVAIGYALALDGGPTVTTGIVSALDRVVKVPDPQCEECAIDDQTGEPYRTYTSVVQTDAAINPGNSGGPLVDLNGNVIAMNSAGAGADSADNIGFAIAIDSAKRSIQDAIDHPAAAQAFLGVTTTTVTPETQVAEGLSVDHGAIVRDTIPKGPADAAGIQPGDVMLEFDGAGVANNDDFAEAIDRARPGDTVEIVFARGDSTVRFDVELGSKPTL